MHRRDDNLDYFMAKDVNQPNKFASEDISRHEREAHEREAKLNAEIASLRTELNSANEKHKLWKEGGIATIEAKDKAAEAERKHMQEELKAAQTNRDNLQKELSTAETDRKHVQEELKAAETDKSNLQARLDNAPKTSSNEAKSIGVPLVGVAAGLGGITLGSLITSNAIALSAAALAAIPVWGWALLITASVVVLAASAYYLGKNLYHNSLFKPAKTEISNNNSNVNESTHPLTSVPALQPT